MGSQKQKGNRVTAVATGRCVPPEWAVRQRYLIEMMDHAAPYFLARTTRPDGTLIWRKEWPGMDASDDGYEGFRTFPLFYLIGGSERIHEFARRQWEAVTWQFTGYGQVYREFDGYYDWMHHGESYTYLYYLAMCNPYHHKDRARALSFAAMYTGEDPEAPNWDSERRMIRSPINGSKGPRSLMTAEDWVTLRSVLANYLTPYEDVPGLTGDDPFVKVDWNDDEWFDRVLKLMNERMVPGDVPLNLNATSLITSAYMYTGEEKYRQWVLDYLTAWIDRTKANNGIMPDNIGPTGKIGERMNGNWWGGYYGWRWPHGARMLLLATLVAGANATLLTGDVSWLELHRSQLDLLWSLRQEDDGIAKIPHRYGAKGWFDYRPPDPEFMIHLYCLSRAQEDLQRIEERTPVLDDWSRFPRFGKGGSFRPEPWFAFIKGKNPDFPNAVLDDTSGEIFRRLDMIDEDYTDPESRDEDFWMRLNPVIPEGLTQMAMGTPTALYLGGHLHADVRYFDPRLRRPGLPEGVAALVNEITTDTVSITLVNTDPLRSSAVLMQAGSFGEHEFTRGTMKSSGGGKQRFTVIGKHLRLNLGHGVKADLRLKMKRFAHHPSYDFPDFDD